MEKIKLSIWLLVVIPIVTFSQERNRVDFILEEMKSHSSYVMINAHRGDWSFFPENSVPAYEHCIYQQFDIIEIDVAKTKDGKLIIMHDATVNRTTNGKGRVKDMTWEEIQKLRLRTPIGRVTDLGVPSLEEVFLLAKGKILLQIDKWPGIEQDILALAEQQGILHQLIFRSTKEPKEVKEVFGDYLQEIQYIPVISAKSDADIQKYETLLKELDFDVLGLAYTSEDYAIVRATHRILQDGKRIWVNTLSPQFNAGYDDAASMNDPEKGYGHLIKKGVSIMMTDNPNRLLHYLQSKNLRK